MFNPSVQTCVDAIPELAGEPPVSDHIGGVEVGSLLDQDTPLNAAGDIPLKGSLMINQTPSAGSIHMPQPWSRTVRRHSANPSPQSVLLSRGDERIE
jgi:hypothetical protein